MSQENVNRALELLDAFNRRDLDAFTALTHDQIEVESRLVAMEGGYHGHKGLRRWWEDFLGAFPDYNLEVEELRDLGDVTLGHMRGWGHAANSATPLVDPFWIPMRWRDKKLIWWRNCATRGRSPRSRGAAGVAHSRDAHLSRARSCSRPARCGV
ncbi:MAG: nuclear transport factor 2 family protein [Thermoleophilaceae bacterium]